MPSWTPVLLGASSAVLVTILYYRYYGLNLSCYNEAQKQAPKTISKEGPKSLPPATIYVCTKCSCNNRPSSTPSPDGAKPKTGLALWSMLVNAFETSTRWSKVGSDAASIKPAKEASCTDLAFQLIPNAPETNPNASEPNTCTIRLREQQCFSACSRANCVVFSDPQKYSFHFGNLEPQLADIEDLLVFAEKWSNSIDASELAKATARPARLDKASTISRIPPLC